MSRKLLVATAVAAASVAAALISPTVTVQASERGSAHKRLPDTYVVSHQPDFQPEGIEVTPDGTMYVSSIGTGDVYRGHVTSRTFTRFASGAAADRTRSLGIEADRRGQVYVAGESHLDVYRVDGTLIARRAAGAGPIGAPYLNDVVVTQDAVYVTDSTNAVVWRAPMRGSRVGELERWFDARTVYPGFPPQYFFLNGIAATRDGETLLVSSQGLETLIRVDVAAAKGTLVDLGDRTFGPDGMVLRGTTVYGVLNYGAPDGVQGVYIAQLNDDLTAGTVTRSVVHPDFDTPSTVAVHWGRLLVVNSQIDSGTGTPPYTVTAAPDPTSGRAAG